MSRLFEYNTRYYKFSNKMLKLFDVYTIEEFNIGINLLCKELELFLDNQEKRKMYTETIVYESSICDFSKLNSSFKDKVINKVLIELNSIKMNKYNPITINKLNDFIED